MIHWNRVVIWVTRHKTFIQKFCNETLKALLTCFCLCADAYRETWESGSARESTSWNRHGRNSVHYVSLGREMRGDESRKRETLQGSLVPARRTWNFRQAKGRLFLHHSRPSNPNGSSWRNRSIFVASVSRNNGYLYNWTYVAYLD